MNISSNGKLLEVIPLKVESGNSQKLALKILTVPEQKIRSSGISANFMCDNSSYVLGIDNKGKPERSKSAFLAFKSLHQEILSGASGQAAHAILNFLEKWNVNEALDYPELKEFLEEILKGSNIVFRLDGELDYLHNDSEIRRLWEAYIGKSEDEIWGQCLIDGEYTPIAKLHPPIKNVKNAQSSGAPIVSFNANAYESYDKENGYIAPISKQVAFVYTTVLNHMLASPKQKVQIGDATTVFWAESPEDLYVNLAAELFNPQFNQEEKSKKKENRRDPQVEELVKEILIKAKTGSKMNNLKEMVDTRTKFYVLGLSPNAGRISVRFFYEQSFGAFVEKALQHYKDMEVVKDYVNRPDNLPIWKLISETVSPKSTSKEASPLLSGAFMRSILAGGLYPQSLYQSILQRVKTDSEERVNYVRAAVIKACLLRKSRITKNTKIEEVLTVALNENTSDRAYLIGRLFAVLEKTQSDAGNETIRARYFTSAMTNPGTTFPVLLRLAQHHIAKAKYGFLNDKKIESILNQIESFPKHFNLDDQGIFTLGYYHQRVKLWEKQEKDNQNSKEEN